MQSPPHHIGNDAIEVGCRAESPPAASEKALRLLGARAPPNAMCAQNDDYHAFMQSLFDGTDTLFPDDDEDEDETYRPNSVAGSDDDADDADDDEIKQSEL